MLVHSTFQLNLHQITRKHWSLQHWHKRLLTVSHFQSLLVHEVFTSTFHGENKSLFDKTNFVPGMHMSVFFVINDWRLEVVDHFVETGWIVDHCCLIGWIVDLCCLTGWIVDYCCLIGWIVDHCCFKYLFIICTRPTHCVETTCDSCQTNYQDSP